MSAEETYSVPARPGTPADMSRRMDRMETAHEVLAKEVSGLTTTIARVELNQNHSEELNKLRSDAVTTALAHLDSRLIKGDEKLELFMNRIERILTGEEVTQQSRASEATIAEWTLWRRGADEVLTQVRFLGKMAVFIVGGSLGGFLLSVYAVFFQPN